MSRSTGLDDLDVGLDVKQHWPRRARRGFGCHEALAMSVGSEKVKVESKATSNSSALGIEIRRGNGLQGHWPMAYQTR